MEMNLKTSLQKLSLLLLRKIVRWKHSPSRQIKIGLMALLICGLSFGYPHKSLGQNNDPRTPALKKIVPPLPEAASLGKFGDVPVSLYTGIPNITVPLFQLEGKSLSVPLSLQYHGSGIKVNEISSRVGLGWALNAGGVISRTVKGAPDESTSGNQTGYLALSNPPDCNDATLKEQVARGFKDGEPDMFTYNFMGHSGKFVFDQDGNIFTIPQNKLLEFTTTIDQGDIVSWTVRDENGISYSFDAVERRRVRTKNTFTNSGQGPSDNLGFPVEMNTSWFLTKVSAPFDQDEITFEYSQYTLAVDPAMEVSVSQFDHRAIGNNSVDCIDAPNGGTPTVNTYICQDYTTSAKTNSEVLQGQTLTSIRSDLFKVEFIEGINRLDLSSAKSLGLIRLTELASNLRVKEFELGHSHFSVLNQDPSNPNFNHRLRLDQVKEVGYELASQNAIHNPPYEFTYNQTKLPPRNSYAQDHWGYYNGKITNNSLIPAMYNHAMVTYFPGADREPNFSYMAAQSLEEIKYPTGGISKFVFEPHDYAWIGDDLQLEKAAVIDAPILQTNTTIASQTCSGFLTPSDYHTNSLNIDHGQAVKIISLVKTGCVPSVSGKAPKVWITYNNSNSQVYDFSGSTSNNPITENHEATIWLTPGNYTVHAEKFGDADEANISVLYKEKELLNGAPILSRTTSAGGLRIKQIMDDDVLGNTKSTAYSYESSEYPGESSGALTVPVKYDYDQNTFFFFTCTSGEVELNCIYYTRASQSNYPLSTTGGSHIGYNEVSQERTGSVDVGKTVYEFSSPSDYPDQLYSYYPVGNIGNYDWARGNLTRQTDLNGQGEIVRRIENTYLVNTAHTLNGMTGRVVRDPTFQHASFPPIFSCHPYEVIIGNTLLKSTKETQFDSESGMAISTINNLNYNSYDQLFKTEVIDNAGQSHLSETFYPLDYLSSNAPAFIQEMQSAHILSDPIEILSKITQGNTEFVSSGTYTEFSLASDPNNLSGAINPIKIYVLENDQILDNSTFTSSIQHPSGSKDPLYKPRLNFDTYSEENYLLSQKLERGTPISYIWDKTQHRVLAKIINSHANEIAYSSFETTDHGNWNYVGGNQVLNTGKTGKHCFSNPEFTSSLDDDSYLISFWAKGLNGNLLLNGSSVHSFSSSNLDWEYLEFHVDASQAGASPQIEVTATGLIDELRLHPADAQMSTYCYDEALRVITSTDVNSQSTYYEYDGLGRLIKIFDQNGNLLNKTDYLYHTE